MARPITYDPKAVRARILDAFWSNGYAQTSLKALEGASGLDRRQLYNGHGDKRGMFLQALDDFSEEAGRRFLAPLEAESAGLKDIDTLLTTFVALAAEDDGSRGCLVCTTSQEEIAADPAVASRLNAYFDRIEAAYVNALARASERGEIGVTADRVRDAAARLLSAHVALCVLGRAGQPAERLSRIAREAVAAAAAA